jgi:hypothetical protein
MTACRARVAMLNWAAMAKDAVANGQTEGKGQVGQATGSRLRGWALVRRHVMDLLIVFVGVYAAFLLNRYDTYRRDEQRRLQILDSLEHETSENLHEFESDLAQVEPDLATFKRELAEGKMPHLGIEMTNPSYDASDDATLLQAGGLELLDVRTIELLRQKNDMQRSLVAAIHNNFEISLAELANHQSADFYDQNTHQLKPMYSWYPYVLTSVLNQAKALIVSEKELLAHIHSQQHPGATP